MARKSEHFTQELADRICEHLAAGESLRSIAQQDWCPVTAAAIRWWVIDDYEGFAAQYTRARDIGLDAMADELLHIADTPEQGSVETSKATGLEVKTGDMTEHRRLRVDSRKWYLSKLAPKRYGDRLNMEHSGEMGVTDRTLDDAQRASKIAAIFEAARRRAQDQSSDIADLL